MKMTKTVTLGKNKVVFQFEGNTLFEAVANSKYIGFAKVSQCGICKSDDLRLDCHEAQGFKYTTIKCNSCRASLTLGERKDHSAVYLRKNEQGYPDWKEAPQGTNSPKPTQTHQQEPTIPPATAQGVKTENITQVQGTDSSDQLPF